MMLTKLCDLHLELCKLDLFQFYNLKCNCTCHTILLSRNVTQFYWLKCNCTYVWQNLREIVYFLQKEATEEAVKLLKVKLKGHGGAIAIDKNGFFWKSIFYSLMSWASIKDDQLIGGFKKDEEGNAKLLYNERL